MHVRVLTVVLIALLSATVSSTDAREPRRLDKRFYPYNATYESNGRSWLVRKVQLALEEDGYYVGDNKGQFGYETRTAIRRYRRDHGLPIVGKIDLQLLTTLGFH